MQPIKIQFLGTGNAIPTKLRNHTGILITYANEQILIDCGENIQRQFRFANLSPTKLTRLLVTHWHGDHILGIPGLLQTLAMSNYQKTLHIYGPPGTKRHFQNILQLINRLNIKTEIHEVHTNVSIKERDFNIESQPMDHGTPTLAYAFVLKNKRKLDKKKLQRKKIPNMPLLKQLQEGKDIMIRGKKIHAKDFSCIEKGKKITIILDTGMNNRAINIAKNSDLIICESTFSNEEKNKAQEYKHLTASNAAIIAKRAKAQKLILTHISERYEHNPHIIEKEAKKIFKNTSIAKDFDIVEI